MKKDTIDVRKMVEEFHHKCDMFMKTDRPLTPSAAAEMESCTQSALGQLMILDLIKKGITKNEMESFLSIVTMVWLLGYEQGKGETADEKR